MKPKLVIGLAGGTGAGKSTLVTSIVKSRIGASVSVLPHDEYYRNPEDMSSEIRDSQNWDHPDAIETSLFIEHLDRLLQGETIERPQYCMETHRRMNTTERVEPKPILVVEGILIFAIPEIRSRLNWRVFLEASSDERIIRRILRDTKERNRSLDSVITQYRTSTRAMHHAWIEPSREHAHMIMVNDRHSEPHKGAQMLIGFLADQLSHEAGDHSSTFV